MTLDLRLCWKRLWRQGLHKILCWVQVFQWSKQFKQVLLQSVCWVIGNQWILRRVLLLRVSTEFGTRMPVRYAAKLQAESLRVAFMIRARQLAAQHPAQQLRVQMAVGAMRPRPASLQPSRACLLDRK